MASPNITSALSRLESDASSQPQTARAQAYIDLIPHVPQTDEDVCAASYNAIFTSALSTSPALSLMSLRPFLEVFVTSLRSISSPLVRTEAGQHALQTLSTRPSGTFEDVDASLRELLADAYEASDSYIQSAQQLSLINLDSSQRKVSDEYKFGILVRIIRCYIEEEETIQAAAYLSKAKNLIFKVHDPTLKLQFALSEARILDALRHFLPAADRYLSVSLSPAVDTDERLMALSSSITCAVLAPAGPNRSKILSRLYRDERSLQLPSPQYSILEKMHLDRPLDPQDIAAFREIVRPHHLALNAEGVTVFDKAVIEHNLLATSKLYDNITIAALGEILGVDKDNAGDYAEKMVQQDRLTARIDQIDEIIYFDGGEDGPESGGENKAGKVKIGGGPGKEGEEMLRLWERNVRGVVEDVERVMGLVGSEFPGWVEKQMGAQMVR